MCIRDLLLKFEYNWNAINLRGCPWYSIMLKSSYNVAIRSNMNSECADSETIVENHVSFGL